MSHTSILLIIGLLVGCASCSPAAQSALQAEREAEPSAQPVEAEVELSVAEPPDAGPPDASTATPSEAAPGTATPSEHPDAPCVRVTDCRIVARHPFDSSFAREHGFYESPAGHVASRNNSWHEHGTPEDTFFIETTESCDTEMDYYIESGGKIWLPFVDMCLAEACTADLAGWTFVFGVIEEQHNARRFRPLGRDFYTDGRHVFDRSEILHVDDVDRATFHACVRPPEGADRLTFYPSAEDARGVYGYGDCGDLVRSTR